MLNDAQVGDVHYFPEDLDLYYNGKISEDELKKRHAKRLAGQGIDSLRSNVPLPPNEDPQLGGTPSEKQEQAPVQIQKSVGDANATPGAIEAAAKYGLEITSIKGSGKGGRVGKADVEAAAKKIPPPPPPTVADKEIDATDAAKKEASIRSVDLHEIEGSGKEDKITVEDVKEVAPDPAPPPPNEDETTGGSPNDGE